MRHHGGERRRPVVSVANTELALLEYLKSTIGAGHITRKRISRTHHTPSFTYVIYSRQALTLLARITPFLRTHKRHRAELLLQSYVLLTPRNGRYTPEMAAARDVFEQQFLAIRVRAPNGSAEQGTVSPAGHSDLHADTGHSYREASLTLDG
jgi:hypothetical protein